MKLLGKRAFTLLELMIAAGILLIVILGLLAMLVNCIIMYEANNNSVIAINDAQYVLEQIKALPYDSIAGYSAPDLTNLNNESISLTRSIGSNIAEVSVTVNWIERQRDKSFVLSTRIHR